MGLPMIVSMILQAVYNIVDTAFVINMGEDGIAGNLALTYAFPVQLLMIAIGVGTGVGINALLSKSLGEGDRKKASGVVGNGIFLGVCVFAVFLLFGLFGAKPFIAAFTGDRQDDVFDHSANFGRGCQYRLGLYFYLPVQPGRCGCGVGDGDRADPFARRCNALPLSEKQRGG